MLWIFSNLEPEEPDEGEEVEEEVEPPAAAVAVTFVDRDRQVEPRGRKAGTSALGAGMRARRTSCACALRS